MAKAQTKDIIKEILKTKSISEQEINLLKRRLNSGEKMQDLMYDIDEYIKLTGNQTQKGLKYLLNKWQTPKGATRKTNPFGYRETEVLDTFKEFYFAGFRSIGFWNNFYVPVYTVQGEKGYFDYHLNGGKIEIVG